MPAIPIYQQRTSVSGAGDGPGPMGHSNATIAGQVLEQVGNDAFRLAEFQKHEADQNELLKANTAVMDARAAWAQQMQERKQNAQPGADGFTPQVLSDFDKDVADRLKDVKNPKAKAFMTDRLNTVRLSLLDDAIQFEAAARHEHKMELVDQSTNSAAIAARMRPQDFDNIVMEQQGAISNFGLSPIEQAEKLPKARQDIAQAAVLGMIDKSPAAMIKELKNENTPFLAIKALDANQREQLTQHAHAVMVSQEVDANRERALAEQAQREHDKATQNDFIARLYNGQLSAKEVLNSDLPAFGEGSKNQFLNMLKATDGGTAGGKTDPHTFNSLFQRIHLPDGDPNKLTNENVLNQYVGNGLDMTDLQRLRNEIQGNNTAEGSAEADLKKGLFAIAKNTLTRSNEMTGIKDPNGDEQLQKWNAWFISEYQKQRGKGLTAQQLLDPNSKDYLGNSIRSYARSPQQIMNDIAAGFVDNSGPAIGTIKNGYKFKGGDPAKPENWVKQ